MGRLNVIAALLVAIGGTGLAIFGVGIIFDQIDFPRLNSRARMRLNSIADVLLQIGMAGLLIAGIGAVITITVLLSLSFLEKA